jgi:hypothetical protein
MLVTVASSVAIAQPSTVDPAAPDSDEPEAKPVYSRALAERPLLLPEGVSEVDATFVVRNDKSVFFDGGAKVASRTFELAFGLAYRLSDQSEREPDLETLYVSGLRDISPCHANQLAVGGQIVGTRLFGELPAFAPSLIAAYKRTLRRWFALQGFALLGYEYSQARDLGTNWEAAQHGLGTTLGARAQLQASSVIAFEARASVSYRQDLADYTGYGLTSFGSQMLGGMLLISASDNADVFFSYDALVRSGDRQREAIVFGLAFRRL